MRGKSSLETPWLHKEKEVSCRGVPVGRMIGERRWSTIRPLRQPGHYRVGRESGSLCSLEFGSWCRAATGTARLRQLHENLSASGILTVESICVSQIYLRAELIILTGTVVPWRLGDQLKLSG
jgi:hypothetical protein